MGDAEMAAPPSTAGHLQLDSTMGPQVIKFCYRKRPTSHSRNGKDDGSQDPRIQTSSSPLSRQSLSTPVITTYHAGGFYEVEHEMQSPGTPIYLKSIRAVKVSEFRSLDITVSFLSLLALRTFFSSFRAMHQDSFWLVNPCLYDFSVSSHPATLPDMLSSPEAPRPQPKQPAPSCHLLDTLKCDGAGWGVRRQHNADGAMEYWLEPADLAEVRREAGLCDPYWVPPPGWEPRDDMFPAAGDLLVKRQVEQLAEELNDVKRYMEQLSSNMVELGKEAKYDVKRAYSSWKEKYQKVARANEKIEKQVLALKMPHVIKFCYRKRPTSHSRNGKGDSSQDPRIEASSSPLSRQSLSTPVITTYHAGGFYEIKHEMLPPRTPIHLKSIRVVQVSEYTSLDITMSFPSLLALQSLFYSFWAPSAGPELDECFVMRSDHMALILRRRVAELELQSGIHQDSIWLINPCLCDFNASSHPAMLPDALSLPEAPLAQPKAPAPSCRLLDTLKCDGAGWGVRHCVNYIGRHCNASKEASIGCNETEASVKQQQRPAEKEDKRSCISSKRKRDKAERRSSKSTHFVASILRALFTIIMISTMFSVGSSASICDSSDLAETIFNYCNSTARTMACCEPIVFAVDVGGGVDCLCLISHHPVVKKGGHSFKALLASYIDCGGLHPEVFHQTSLGYCAATPPSPPQPKYSPPPPTFSAPTTKPPGSASYWDGWNDQLAGLHDAFGLPHPMYMLEGAIVLILGYLCNQFKAYMKSLLLRIFRWVAGHAARVVGHQAQVIFDHVEVTVFRAENE